MSGLELHRTTQSNLSRGFQILELLSSKQLSCPSQLRPMASLPKSSRAGCCPATSVGTPADSGHAARHAGLDADQKATPACASAGAVPLAAGVVAAPAGNASILVRRFEEQEVAARGVGHTWRDNLRLFERCARLLPVRTRRSTRFGACMAMESSCGSTMAAGDLFCSRLAAVGLRGPRASTSSASFLDLMCARELKSSPALDPLALP